MSGPDLARHEAGARRTVAQAPDDCPNADSAANGTSLRSSLPSDDGGSGEPLLSADLKRTVRSAPAVEPDGGVPSSRPPQELPLVVGPAGAVQTLYDERLDLSALGPLTIERASHVEPTPDGRWAADLCPVGGPVLGPFRLRSEALAAEVAWIQTHVLT